MSERLLVALSCGVYCLVFHWAYAEWMQPLYYYFGMDSQPYTMDRLIVSYFFFLLPVIWLPLKIDRPSKILYWFIYLFCYIPILFIPFTSGYSDSNFYGSILSVSFGFWIIGLHYLFRIKGLQIKRLEANLVKNTIVVSTIIISLIVVIVLRGELRIVVNIIDSEAILAQRFLENTNRGKIAYPIAMMSSILLPFLLIYGLFFKNRVYILLSILGQILLYSIGSNKAYILSIALMLLVYFLMKRTTRYFGLRIILGTCFLLLPLVSSQLYLKGELQEKLSPLTALIMVRTVGISSVNFSVYHYFFNSNPLTYYSHVSIIANLVEYPYDRPLGRVVGNYSTGSELLNMNATFWITDGIAACGYLGVIIISIICGIAFFFTGRCSL